MSNSFTWDLTSLSPIQKKIADFIEKNIEHLPFMTERDIAAKVPTSIASVSRFWSAVGFSNLKEFKKSIQIYNEVTPANKMKNTFNRVSEDDLPGALLEGATAYLSETSRHLSRDTFEQAVEKIIQANKIFIFSPGPSEGLGTLLRFRLNRFGMTIQPMPNSGHELFESLVNISANDAVICFSFANLLPETRVILDYAADVKFTTIVITDLLVTDLNQLADIVLYAARGQIWEFHSMVAPTAVIESLIIAVGFRLQEHSVAKLDMIQTLRKRYALLLPR